jgi:Lantibiotic biosynthesis dehydratase C-term
MWRLIRIYYYAKNKDVLLTQCLWPLLDRGKKDSLFEHAYVDRHWAGGPHLRVYLYNRDSVGESVLSAVISEIRRYLAQYPSTETSSTNSLRTLKPYLASWELIDPSRVSVPKPDNSVEVDDDDATVEFWSGPEMLDTCRFFFSRTLYHVVRWTAAIAGEQHRRLVTAFDLMGIFGAKAGQEGLRQSHVMYRSHAEGFLSAAGEHYGKLREQFEERYVARRAELTARLERIATVEQGSDLYTTFMSEVTAARDSIRAICSRPGWLETWSSTRPGVYSRKDSLIQVSWPKLAEKSEFHRVLVEDAYQQFMRHDVGFNVTRLSVNLLYATLGFIQLTPVERYQLCWFVARASEDIFRVNTIDLVRQYAITLAERKKPATNHTLIP